MTGGRSGNGRAGSRKGDHGRRDFLRMAGAAAALAAGTRLGAARALAGAAAGFSETAPAALKRPLGTTGLAVSPVGMGAMTTRDADVVRYAVDHGVDYVDTADCYMGGENERIVGRALEGVRHKVVLATKVHIAPVEAMIRSVENSLRSLKTDVVDVMQLHGIATEGEVLDGRAREALSKLIEQGKIRVPGVTTHSGQETVIRAVMKHGFYRTVLVSYNFRSDAGYAAFAKDPAGTTVGLTKAIVEAGRQGIGVIGMKTQAGGYSVPGGPSPHQAALAWVLSNPGIALAIPGMVSFAQVDENLKARGLRLGWSGRKTLARYERAIADRHCSLCGRCERMCPRGVDVPGVLRCLAYREGYREEELARESYRSLPSGRNGLACAGCRGCAVRCRLGLPVGRLARRAHGMLG